MKVHEGIKLSMIPWWYAIIGVDFFLLIITVANVYLPEIRPVQKLIIYPFNLAVESNLAVWWSGITLSVLGLLSFELFNLRDDQTKKAWLALSILFFGLSADEVCSLHERIGSWSNLLPFGIVCCALFIYALYTLIRTKESKKTGLFILVAFFLYGSVVFQEYLEHAFNWPNWALGIRVGIEEGCELLATFLIYCGIVPQRNFNKNTVSAIIPRPHLINILPKIVLWGLCLHIILILLWPSLMSYSNSHRGNPLTFYPMNIFLILFCTSFWMWIKFKKNRFIWFILALLFLLCSADIVATLLKYLPYLRDLLPGKSLSYLLNISPLFVLFFWTLRQGRTIREILFLAISILVVLFSSVLYHIIMKSIPMSIWSLVVAFCAFSYFYLVEKTRKHYSPMF